MVVFGGGVILLKLWRLVRTALGSAVPTCMAWLLVDMAESFRQCHSSALS